MAPLIAVQNEALSEPNNAPFQASTPRALSTRSLSHSAKIAVITVPCVASPLLVILIVVLLLWLAQRRKQSQTCTTAPTPRKQSHSLEESMEVIPPFTPTAASPRLDLQRLSVICEDGAGDEYISTRGSVIIHDTSEETKSVRRESEDSRNVVVVPESERKRAARMSARSSTWSIRLITELDEVCGETDRADSSPI
ncbi:hypothetical protein Tdes44962_MAKER04488 [Teratosphaeria destructans]|uniref:Uncharacterized protein n=1 Tax=Teratosphaeria destructans TaxID=418781 RepID=A0A9W7SMG3_9PEZI|nr:hypothetical protein Tdes44962_MAKER04488 [Teratosphaeria destructans]